MNMQRLKASFHFDRRKIAENVGGASFPTSCDEWHKRTYRNWMTTRERLDFYSCIDKDSIDEQHVSPMVLWHDMTIVLWSLPHTTNNCPDSEQRCRQQVVAGNVVRSWERTLPSNSFMAHEVNSFSSKSSDFVVFHANAWRFSNHCSITKIKKF